MLALLTPAEVRSNRMFPPVVVAFLGPGVEHVRRNRESVGTYVGGNNAPLVHAGMGM